MADDTKKKTLEEMMAEDEGAGFENVTSSDLATPYLQIIQSGSPQLKPSDSKYLPTAKQGLILQTISGSVFEKITIVPVQFATRYVEWIPRSQGGGIVAMYDQFNVPSDTITDSVTRFLVRPNGNEVKQTAYYLVLLKEEDWNPVILPMQSTQFTKSRNWLSVMRAIRAGGKSVPMYGCQYEFGTVEEDNKKGSWYGWKISQPTVITDEGLYLKAREASKIQNFLPERVLKAITNDSGEVM